MSGEYEEEDAESPSSPNKQKKRRKNESTGKKMKIGQLREYIS